MPACLVHAEPRLVACAVLDFEGVCVDSASEVSLSAVVAARHRWPGLMAGIGPDSEQEAELLTAMRVVRPVLVKGFESLVMVG